MNTIARGKESTSISRRHATGNAHQRVNKKKPKGKYPIQKGGGMLKRKKIQKELEEINA